MTSGSESGEAAAGVFTELFDRTFTDLWNYVRRRVVSGADADDVTAEIFAVAWRRHHLLPPPDEQRMWLFGVARNVLRNHQRSTFRQQRLVARLAGLGETIAGTTAERVEQDDGLWLALARLSIEDRDLLIMRAWDHLSVGEIATLLDCTPNAVSVRLNKARNRLRSELAEKECRLSGNEVLNPNKRGEPDAGIS